MIVTVAGVGIWGRGITGWADFRSVVEGRGAIEGDFAAPRPAAIGARERRRVGLAINLAVEVMHQACDMAGSDKSAVGSVFASAMGDTDITDYMCRKLATEDKLLSPTKFHNSVHNAASGYWSISAQNRQPSSFVGAFEDTFAHGLLEAAACALAAEQPVALSAYDIANEPPFHDVMRIDETLGLAMLLYPGSRRQGLTLNLAVEARDQGTALPRPIPGCPALAELARANPMGTGLALLEQFVGTAEAALTWPLGSGTGLCVHAAGTPPW